MKSHALLFSVSLAVLPGILCAIPVGRGEVSVALSGTGTYDSNLAGSRASSEDYYGTVTPQVGYVRRAGNLEAEASASLAFIRFVEQKQYDTENARIAATLRLSAATFQKLSAAAHGSYSETSDVNADVNARLKSATTSFTGESTWLVGPRMDFGLTGGYTDSIRTGASDARSLNLGTTYGYRDFFYDNTLNATYNFQSSQSSGENARSAKLDQTSHLFSLGLGRPLYRDVTGRISAGYRMVERSAAETLIGQTEQSGIVLNASIDGPFLPRKYFPKVSSRAHLSYEEAATPGINDTGTKQLGADISIIWEAGPKSSVSLLASRSQRLSVTDFTVLSTGVRAVITQKLRYNLNGSLAAAHNWESFRGIAREDRRRTIQGDLNYRFATRWHAAASYQFESILSSIRRSSYDRHLATLTLGWEL